MKLKSLSIAFLLLGTNVAYSQNEPQSVGGVYAIPGNCSSQGAWTQQALSHTNRLKEIIKQLRDNPACKGIQDTLKNSLAQVSQKLEEVQSQENEQTRKAKEMDTNVMVSRNFTNDIHSGKTPGGDLFKNSAINLLFRSTLLKSAMSSNYKVQEQVRKIGYSANEGLGILNSTISAMTEAQSSCLDNVNVGVSAGATLVKLLSTFVSSGSGTDPQMALAVQNIGQYFSRDKKYADAIRKLEDREFITSMSCLVEVTAENFCSARDAYYLMDDVLKSQTADIKQSTFKNAKGETQKSIVIKGENENFKKAALKGPLSGYYILTRQVPVVTNWILKVQYGNSPQLPTEAEFQVNIIQNIQNMQINMKKIEGSFNFQVGQMKQPEISLTDKQGYLLGILRNVTRDLQRGGGNDSENFFVKGTTEPELYFKLLLGMEVPLAVQGKGEQGLVFGGDSEKYLIANYKSMPQFQDPEATVHKIRENLREVFRNAEIRANAYYMKYFIVDKNQVVQDSLIGLDTNVREALGNIDLYLKDLELRLANDKKHASTVGFIKDTRSRIGQVLARYVALHKYGLEIINRKDIDQKTMEKELERLGFNLLQEVYTQFQVMLARAGWLVNRMTGYVMYDYTVSLRKQTDFSPYINELLYSSGYQILSQMFGMTEIPYTKVTTDLNTAMNIYSRNFDSLEKIVESPFVRNLNKLKLEAENQPYSDLELAIRYEKEAFMRGFVTYPDDLDGPRYRLFRGLKSSFLSAFFDQGEIPRLGLVDSILLPITALTNATFGQRNPVTVRVGNEFFTAEKEHSLLCTQALAFKNLRPYWYTCKDAQLQTPLMAADPKNKELMELMNNYLSINFRQKAWEGIEKGRTYVQSAENSKAVGTESYQRALNMSNRVCALRDYHRRNEVARVTAAMRDDLTEYENEYTKLFEENVTTAIPEAPIIKDLSSELPDFPVHKDKKPSGSNKNDPKANKESK